MPIDCRSNNYSLDGDHQQQQSGSSKLNPVELYQISTGYTEPEVSAFVKPTFYTLRLKVDPMRQKFTGQLMITLEIGQPQPEANPAGYRYLTLHAGNNLHIKKAFYVFTSRGSVQIPAASIGRNAASELLTIDFHPNTISAGQGLLLLVYTGLVNSTDSYGLFLHKHKGKRQPVVAGEPAPDDSAGLASQMQPDFARRLFPAWDEPHLKARFSLIVVLPNRGYVTLSNMPIKRKSISVSCSGERLQEIEFHTTPVMSTYLVALVIGRFDYVEAITPNNCKVRVYVYAVAGGGKLSEHQANPKPADQAPPANPKKQAAQLGLEVAVKTLDRLESLLGIQYPLSKFDMVALRNFDNGGMENWGASIFHEHFLLYDNSSGLSADISLNNARNKQRRIIVPLVVAHEVAHQWFGNLLTSQSWTYLWLNEGFAQLLMYELADHLFPGDNYWNIFLEDNRQNAMREDELITSSHLLEYEPLANQSLNQTDEAQLQQFDRLSLFNQLTYNKGAMVVRITYFLLGRQQFFAGLHHYLHKHSYGSVSSHDLWLAIEESTGREEHQLESLMTGWLRQEGFPLISVQAWDEGAHYRVRLTQERFLLMQPNPTSGDLNGTEAREEAKNWEAWRAGQWSVHVGVSSELKPMPSGEELQLAGAAFKPARPNARVLSGSQASFLLADRAISLQMPKALLGHWFKLNFNATGYYRVNYLSPSEPLQPDGSSGGEPVGDGSNNGGPFMLGGGGNQLDLLERMAVAVRSKSMCVIDRFNLADDLFAMAMAAKKPTAYYLRYLFEAFDEETEIIVLRFIVDSLKRIKATIVSNSPSSEGKLSQLFDRYVQKYLRKVSEAVSRSKDTHHHHSASNSDSASSSNSNSNANSNLDSNADALPRATPDWHWKLNWQRGQSNSMLADAAPAMGVSEANGNTDARPTDSNNNNNQQQSREIEDLIDGQRVLFNQFDSIRRAADSFSANFRNHRPPADSGKAAPSNSHFLDALDREMRAAIYLGALKASVGVKSDQNATLNDLLPSRRAPANATSQTSPELGLPSRPTNYLASALVGPILRAPSAISPSAFVPDHQQAPQAAAEGLLRQLVPVEVDRDELFLRLLKAYESSESSAERYAISFALGSSGEPARQLPLLNLTLYESFFRPLDMATVLDAMARDPRGRQLIWTELRTNIRRIEQHRLLTLVLRSLANGLIEPAGQNGLPSGEVEAHLRSLYKSHGAVYGKLIGQLIEMVRVNTQWFWRDHAGLLQYLEAADLTGPD